MARKAVEDGVFSKLTADQSAGSFYDDLTGRVYLDQAPEDSALPLAVLSFATDAPDRYLPDKADVDAEFDIDLFGNEGQSDLQATNTKLFTLLDNQTVTITGFVGGNVQCLEPGTVIIEDARPRITSRWRLLATET